MDIVADTYSSCESALRFTLTVSQSPFEPSTHDEYLCARLCRIAFCCDRESFLSQFAQIYLDSQIFNRELAFRMECHKPHPPQRFLEQPFACRYIEIPETDFRAFVFASKFLANGVYVIFVPTASGANWLSNLDAVARDFSNKIPPAIIAGGWLRPFPSGEFHSGFAKLYASGFAHVDDAVAIVATEVLKSASPRIVVTGMSLGGALAGIYAIHHESPRLITFGAPKFAKTSFRLPESFATKTTAFANFTDPVVRVPLRLFPAQWNVSTWRDLFKHTILTRSPADLHSVYLGVSFKDSSVVAQVESAARKIVDSELWASKTGD